MAEKRAARAAFIRRYGGIYEHSPWVAERAWEDASGMEDADRLAEIFARQVDAADDDVKLALIRAHPDLAGRAAVAGGKNEELTAASREEQHNAGIDQCTAEEFARFQDLNARYKQKFQFPFVMAVRNSNRHEILKAFEERLGNNADAEFATAIREIHKIARLRLRATHAPPDGRPPAGQCP